MINKPFFHIFIYGKTKNNRERERKKKQLSDWNVRTVSIYKMKCNKRKYFIFFIYISLAK